MKKKERNQYHVTPEQVIDAFFEHMSYEAAAQALGMPVHVLSQRINAYRARGVALPRLPRKNIAPVPKLNIEALNARIEALKAAGGSRLPRPTSAKVSETPKSDFESLEITKEYEAPYRTDT